MSPRVPAGSPEAGRERISLHWRATLHLLRRLPQGMLSRAWGRFAGIPLPPLVRGLVNGTFVRLVGADADEAEGAPGEYRSLADFFVRRLRPGLRSWPELPGIPGSPVDGILGTFGALERGVAVQAKGIHYRVEELLAGKGGEPFDSGLFFTIYLSPRHYHRIHAPLDGLLEEARAVPGRLLPVNLPAIHLIRDLFPRNERLVALMRYAGASVALVAVGAYNVGRISAEFDPDWTGPGGRGVTNRPGRSLPETRRYEPPLTVLRGQELMVFHMGSTIVLLIGGSGGGARPHAALREGMEIRVGMPLLAEPLAGGRDGPLPR